MPPSKSSKGKGKAKASSGPLDRFLAPLLPQAQAKGTFSASASGSKRIRTSSSIELPAKSRRIENTRFVSSTWSDSHAASAASSSSDALHASSSSLFGASTGPSSSEFIDLTLDSDSSRPSSPVPSPTPSQTIRTFSAATNLNPPRTSESPLNTAPATNSSTEESEDDFLVWTDLGILDDSEDEGHRFADDPKNRRGTRTMALREQTAKRVESYRSVLNELAESILSNYESRLDLIASTPDSELLAAIIELDRAHSERASCPIEVTEFLTAHPQTRQFLLDFAKNACFINFEAYSDVFDVVPQGTEGEFLKRIPTDVPTQRYYIRSISLTCQELRARLDEHLVRYPAEVHQWTVIQALVHTSKEDDVITLSYIGTTYAVTPEERHGEDAANGRHQTRLLHWLKSYCDDHWTIREFVDLRCPLSTLDCSTSLTTKQLYRRNARAAEIEEALIDLARPLLMNSAFGGFGGPKYARINEGDREMVNAIRAQHTPARPTIVSSPMVDLAREQIGHLFDASYHVYQRSAYSRQYPLSSSAFDLFKVYGQSFGVLESGVVPLVSILKDPPLEMIKGEVTFYGPDAGPGPKTVTAQRNFVYDIKMTPSDESIDHLARTHGPHIDLWPFGKLEADMYEGRLFTACWLEKISPLCVRVYSSQVADTLQNGYLRLPDTPAVHLFLDDPSPKRCLEALNDFRSTHTPSDWNTLGCDDWTLQVGKFWIFSHGVSKYQIAISHVHPGRPKYDPTLQILIEKLALWCHVKELIGVSMCVQRLDALSTVAQMEALLLEIEKEADRLEVNKRIFHLAEKIRVLECALASTRVFAAHERQRRQAEADGTMDDYNKTQLIKMSKLVQQANLRMPTMKSDPFTPEREVELAQVIAEFSRCERQNLPLPWHEPKGRRYFTDQFKSWFLKRRANTNLVRSAHGTPPYYVIKPVRSPSQQAADTARYTKISEAHKARRFPTESLRKVLESCPGNSETERLRKAGSIPDKSGKFRGPYEGGAQYQMGIEDWR